MSWLSKAGEIAKLTELLVRYGFCSQLSWSKLSIARENEYKKTEQLQCFIQQPLSLPHWILHHHAVCLCYCWAGCGHNAYGNSSKSLINDIAESCQFLICAVWQAAPQAFPPGFCFGRSCIGVDAPVPVGEICIQPCNRIMIRIPQTSPPDTRQCIICWIILCLVSRFTDPKLCVGLSNVAYSTQLQWGVSSLQRIDKNFLYHANAKFSMFERLGIRNGSQHTDPSASSSGQRK